MPRDEFDCHRPFEEDSEFDFLKDAQPEEPRKSHRRPAKRQPPWRNHRLRNTGS